MDRRQLLLGASATAVGSAFRQTIHAAPQQPAADTLRFFPGFKTSTSKPRARRSWCGRRIGPPLLLLHGAPQSHISWRLVAPQFAKSYTVIVPDLRGYGDSSKPPDGENHANYSKRAMALDQVEVMRHLGFDRFPVVGHDRGGRVGASHGAGSSRTR